MQQSPDGPPILVLGSSHNFFADSGVKISSKYSHSNPHKALKKSIEDTTGKQWSTEQILVPQQDEGESCGYRMLSNLSKVTKGQEIQREREKESNRLYYYLEIAQTPKDNQIKRNQKKKTKKEREEKKKKNNKKKNKKKQKKNKGNNTKKEAKEIILKIKSEKKNEPGIQKR